jgi:pimeloyl-ACP methyl ester carboxylesterase
MTPSTNSTLGPARMVALALVAFAIVGLAFLRFGTGSDQVTVPSGAHAGQLTLHSCHYATEDGSYDADCGTLVVPENRHDRRTRLIALPVTRIHARSAKPGAPIFRLQGGPGITNMQFSDASRFAGRHDVVLVGYRGVDGSARLDCPEVASARAHARGYLTAQSFRDDTAAFKACAHRLQDAGFDLGGYTLPERVDDLDAARRALGYAQVDLLSESAGTRTAMIYSWRYPQRIHRSVMVGVNPPGDFLWDAKTTGEQIRRYAALCAADESCRSRTPDLAAAIYSGSARLPTRWLFLPVKRGNVQLASFFGLMNATPDGGGLLAGPSTIDTLLAAGRGDASGAWLLSTMAQLVFPRVQVWGDVAAVARTDSAYARRFFAAHADRGSVLGSPGANFIWAHGGVLAAWPKSSDEDEYTRVQDSQAETLLVGGDLDFATPPQKATRELLPHLLNGHQVVLHNVGHTDDFWTYEPAASTRLVNTFFETGRVDASRYTPNTVDFTPGTTQGAIAKYVLGTMLGFAVLTLLSLALMATRVRRRGRFGRKSGALLRSVYPFVLGLGGWFIGVLVALVALPTVPLDDPLLAALSIGAPVGLGIYYAWVDRGLPAGVKTAGLFAAIAGALIGAALGFHATGGLFAVLTTIIGAAAGANLAVIALDVARTSYAFSEKGSSVAPVATSHR